MTAFCGTRCKRCMCSAGTVKAATWQEPYDSPGGKRPGSGESKGFDFIKFADKDVEKKVLLQRHMIDGRWCDIKIPESQDRKEGGKDKSSCKIFVGRVTENLSKEDLRDHFEAFGQVTDVYIPSPFRQFAFVQFSESKIAQSLLGKEHMIKVS